MTNGTSTNAFLARDPLTLSIAPTPPGPPSAFCNRSPLLSSMTLTTRFERGVALAVFVSVAKKWNVPTNPEGQPAGGPVVKLDDIGTNETKLLSVMRVITLLTNASSRPPNVGCSAPA